MYGSNIATKVELSISCANLMDKDVSSKSDPSCVVLFHDKKTQYWNEIARTERIKNSLNPNFSRKIQLDYYFEEVQQLRFAIYDIDNSTEKLSDDDFLGQTDCTLGQIVSNQKLQSGLMLKNKKPAGKGTITIEAEEVSDKRFVTFEWKGHKLDKKDTFGKSDPFMEIWKQSIDGSWSLVHRTEVKDNTLNPKWKPFSISVHSLCGEDFEKQIKVTISDADSDGSHDLIGEFYSSLKEMISKNDMEFQVINPKKKAKKSSYKNSGTAILANCKIDVHYSFLDYVFGGLQLNFTVGIDFTGSNGNPRDPNSLHFMNPSYPNDYLQALMAVGAVIQDYDSDKLYPALGFGAKIPPTNELSFEFALNFQPTNPYCVGIQGIVDAYKNALPQIKLWGPTNVAPIINHVARFAAQAQARENRPQNYFVLLLLTDGAITDFDDTRQAIVDASSLPMSIIIVGVGPADFSAMKMLDGDDGKLKSKDGVPVSRDIVQFVPYNNFKQTSYGHDLSSAALAKTVLAEIPTQVATYYRWKDMIPGNLSQTV